MTVPINAVIRRLGGNLAELDRLYGLLEQLVAGYRLTNREGSALLLVDERVFLDACGTLGVAMQPSRPGADPEGADTHARPAPSAPGAFDTEGAQ